MLLFINIFYDVTYKNKLMQEIFARFSLVLFQLKFLMDLSASKLQLNLKKKV